VTPCPPDDVLGAHVQRALSEPEAAVVSSHLDDCPSCREIVLAAIRGGVVAQARSHGSVSVDLAGRTGAPTVAIGTPTVDPAARPSRVARGPGARIGRYELRELLGAGGMGQVYEAYDADLDRPIALKVMRPELAGVVLAERLVRESRMMARLAHPAVITVFDVGRSDGSVFIAMELIRGETLGRYVRRVRPPWREIVALLERAGQGLAAAHDAGIVHRDFKPENVLVEIGPRGVQRVVVTDFGIARVADAAASIEGEPAEVRVEHDVADPQLTRTGTTVGTPAYMPPEQLAGAPLDGRADVFAFAVSAWELVFGERPFAGNSAAEIRRAMETPPEPPHEGPAGLASVLMRGLALDPARRYRDMHAFVRALAAIRTRRRRTLAIGGSALAAVALVGVGLGGSRMLAAPAVATTDEPDPCLRGLAALDAVYSSATHGRLRAALTTPPPAEGIRVESARVPAGSTGQTTKDPLAVVELAATRWRETHVATCRREADPPQPATIAACLEARRIELAGVVDDLLLDGPGHAGNLVALLGDPAACTTPAPGLIEPRVPPDPALRRRVTELRYRMFVVEEARDRGAFKTAVPEAEALAADTKSVWPPLHAEALYVLGTAQSQGGDTAHAISTLRETAALAEQIHHHYIAANAWIQLIHSSAFDLGDPERALEYAAFAEAALQRVANQTNVAVLYRYELGAALAQAQRPDDAELEFRKALALAEQHVPDYVPIIIQGLAFALEGRGRYRDAVAMYREALASDPPPSAPAEITFRNRLAQSLTMLGEVAEAEAEARAAVALAERTVDERNIDRAYSRVALAEALQAAGKLDEALASATLALEQLGRVSGERTANYGGVLTLTAMILSELGRYREADRRFTRACEIAAFVSGERSHKLAECRMHHAIVLSELGKMPAALALAEQVLPVLVAVYGEDHPQVATAYVTRGALRGELGKHALAIADLEQAIRLFETQQLDPGHLGGATYALGLEVYKRDRARGRELIARALGHLEKASAVWQSSRDEARAWLAKHR
jgi:eukaryotic-like serine/threonine-protein kinase